MVGKFTQRPAVELLYSAKESLREAGQSLLPQDRYAAAHLAALRTAAAVLADRAQVATSPRRHRIRLRRVRPHHSRGEDTDAGRGR